MSNTLIVDNPLFLELNKKFHSIKTKEDKIISKLNTAIDQNQHLQETFKKEEDVFHLLVDEKGEKQNQLDSLSNTIKQKSESIVTIAEKIRIATISKKDLEQLFAESEAFLVMLKKRIQDSQQTFLNLSKENEYLDNVIVQTRIVFQKIVLVEQDLEQARTECPKYVDSIDSLSPFFGKVNALNNEVNSLLDISGTPVTSSLNKTLNDTIKKQDVLINDIKSDIRANSDLKHTSQDLTTEMLETESSVQSYVSSIADIVKTKTDVLSSLRAERENKREVVMGMTSQLEKVVKDASAIKKSSSKTDQSESQLKAENKKLIVKEIFYLGVILIGAFVLWLFK